MAGAQFGPDAFCLLSGGMKHPPAGIGMVGEGPVPTEGREVAGTQGPRQLPEMGPVHGAGADLQWVAPVARVARERGCPRWKGPVTRWECTRSGSRYILVKGHALVIYAQLQLL